MRINPYLSFNGQCGEAFRFYERVLGGRIEFMQTYGESPMADETPADMRGWVMHTTLSVDGQTLFGSDSPPEYYEKPQGTYVSINVERASEGERIFNALAEGGSVKMPFEKTFWAAGFGMCVDRYGIPWMVNCEQGD
jgi:PhnB protein